MRNAILSLVIVASLAIVGFYVFEKESGNSQTQEIQTTGMFGAATSVGIYEQNEAIMYEGHRADNIMEIEVVGIPYAGLSFNGSYGSYKAGYDSFDNQTQLFILENVGNTNIDVTISAEDFSSGENFINVGEYSSDFQIYIPGIGWRNVTDNGAYDPDFQKDATELCIANDLGIGKNITGFDFRIKENTLENYTSVIRVRAYDNSTISICNISGSYVSPQERLWPEQ